MVDDDIDGKLRQLLVEPWQRICVEVELNVPAERLLVGPSSLLRQSSPIRSRNVLFFSGL